MLLAYKDLTKLFSETQGVHADMVFHTVSDQADVNQPKGLFISVGEESGALSSAIANGATAAIWDKATTLPHYTPNHFPVFFSSDPVGAVTKLIQDYVEKLNGETDEIMEMTNFKIINKKLLNKNNETYDIAVMLKKIKEKQEMNSERRG